jgi:hypothetical protein
MFGIRDLQRRVKVLEDRAAKAERVANCTTGKHEWEICEHGGASDAHVRCKHCYFHPKDKTESKGGQS